ncbi:MAG: hypothetical protein GTO18_12940 [Anaerolineales bacterium]|nr:hypothetical protein [Anaerolineales bacterium]
MEVLSVIALLLLIMVGYSSGATLAAGRGRTASPTLLDLGILVVLWTIALLSRPALGRWGSIILWVALALLISTLLTRIRLGPRPSAESVPTVKASGPWWRRVWERWKVFAAEMGNYQGRILLAAFYFIVLTPWGIMVRIFSDPLQTRSTSSTSHWSEREDSPPDFEEAQRQF